MSAPRAWLAAIRSRLDALAPRDRALALGAAGVVALIVMIGAVAALRPGSEIGLAPGANAPAPTTATTKGPEPSFTPSPLPEASIVAALPPPREAPAAAVIASPVAAASTRAPATPTPSPDPAVWRVEGVIVEEDTKLPIREVCVVIGPHGCQRGSVRTDSRGVFFIDVPQNPTVFYDLYFVKDGFWTVWFRIKPEGSSVYNLALTKR